MLHSKEEGYLNKLLDASMQRQHLISENIAGARVKGFVGRDLDISMVMHDLRNGESFKDVKTTLHKATYEYDPGEINIEAEMGKLYKNHMTYLLLTRMNGHIYQHMEEATQAGRAG